MSIQRQPKFNAGELNVYPSPGDVGHRGDGGVGQPALGTLPGRVGHRTARNHDMVDAFQRHT